MALQRIFRRLVARSAHGLLSSKPKLLIALLVVAALPALAYWRGLGTETTEIGSNASEMVVETLEQSSNRVNLVLKEKSGPRRLVVSIGMSEAFSIASDLNLASNVPPVTAYSMAGKITDGLGGRVQRIVVNDASDKALFAKVVLATESREVAVDAAPSDAIALAVKTKAPIFVQYNVLDRAGVVSGR